MSILSDYTDKKKIHQRINNFIAMHMDINSEEITDPMLILMLESLSEEIYKISGGIDDMEKRILDKLCNMLVPDIQAMAKPARAIIQVIPEEDQSLITKQTAFYPANNNNLSFYPVCNTILRKGSVQYILHKGMLYTVERTQSKTLLSRAKKTVSFEERSFWIGLKLDQNITDLKGLSFYIDFAHSGHRIDYLKYLTYSTWTINENELVMSRGISCTEKNAYQNKTLKLLSSLNPSEQINRSVKKEYDPYFLSVDGHFDLSGKREIFPKVITESFADRLPTDILEPLVWIKVVCPVEIPEEAITSVQVSINAVPVTCKNLVSKTFKLNPNLPVIALETGNKESFLGICSLTDSLGKEYYEVPLADDNNYGIYSLRRGGCERYGRRESRQYLINTISAIRQESAGFIGEKAGKKNTLDQLRHDIGSLANELYTRVILSTDKYELKNYILLSPNTDHEHLYFLKYWITPDISEERLPLGSLLQGSSFYARLISTVEKGEAVPEQAEKYTAYQRTVGTSPLLITDNDIKEFCLNEFAELASDARVSKGLISSTQGDFIKTIDVYLKPLKDLEHYISINDEHFILEQLKKNSPFTFKYRIFFEKPVSINKN